MALLCTYLENNRYVDSRPIVGADEIRLQVIGQINTAIGAHIVTREVCGKFVDQLLSPLDMNSN